MIDPDGLVTPYRVSGSRYSATTTWPDGVLLDRRKNSRRTALSRQPTRAYQSDRAIAYRQARQFVILAQLPRATPKKPFENCFALRVDKTALHQLSTFEIRTLVALSASREVSSAFTASAMRNLCETISAKGMESGEQACRRTHASLRLRSP